MAVQITREAPTPPPSIPTEARERYRALIRKIKARRPDLASAVSTFQDESLEEELFRQFYERERQDSRAEEIDLFANDYVSIPVPISEFISDPKLAGGWYVENLFDVWKREICTVIEKGTLEWVLCLQKDTPIPLMDGGVRTIRELAADWERDRKPFYVYSLDARRNITVGRASQVRQTGVDRIYRVWLDDGSYVEANARHQFVTLNGRKRKVTDLKPGDSLAPFYRDVSKSNYTPGYETVYCPGENRYRLTHEISGEWKYGDFKLRGGRNVFHHKDFNKRNNAPDNVERARFDWHYQYHARHKQRLLDKNPAQREALRRRMSAVATDPNSPLRRAHAEYIQTDAAKQVARRNLTKIVPDRERAVANGRRVSKEFWQSEAGAAERVVRGARMAASNRNAASIEKRVATQRASGHYASSGRRMASFNATNHPCLRKDITLDAVQEAIRSGVRTAGGVADRLGCSQTRVRSVMTAAGFSSWPEFRAAVVPSNHKVARVEDTGRVEPVYCMTVDRDHNFAVLGRGADGSISTSGVISSNTGSIGAGKCLNSNTIVNTNSGFAKLGSLYGKRPVVQAESGMRRVEQTHDEGVTKTLIVRTKHGHVIEGRPDHRLRVLGEDFSPKWKRLSQLRRGDVVLQAPSMAFGAASIGENLAELIGWFIAEGVRSEGHKKAAVNVAFFHLHPDEIDYVYKLAKSCGDWRVKKNRDYNFVSVYGSGVRDTFPPERSRKKEVPDAVLRAPREEVCAFLRGLFSGDGHVSRRECTLSTVSEALAHQVRVMLTALGIYCSVGESVASYRKGGKRHVTGKKYTVRIIGPDSLLKFEREIGFAVGHKKRALKKSARSWNRNSDHSFAFRVSDAQFATLLSMQPSYTLATCPRGLRKTRTPRGLLHRLRTQRCTVRLLREVIAAGGVLPDVLRGLVEGVYLFDTVADVTPSRAHCHDLSVEGDPSYVAGGFISHNTSAAMLAQMYKLYVVTCMRNPCSFYSSTSITFGLYSAMRYLAYDVGANMLIMRLRESPYFRDVVGISEEEDDPKKTRIKIFNFPNNVRFIFGASQYHGMGQDVYGVIMDEVAFFEGNGAQRARELYASIRTRITSRFKSTAGLVPGIMCLCSSANHEGDFLDEHVQNDALKDRIHVSRFALYDVKKFAPPTFRVLVGERLAGSKILDEVRVDSDGNRTVHPVVGPEDIPEGARIENVPAEMYTDYNDDLQQALKDISGIGMATDTVFFPNMDKVDLAWDAAKNPVVTPREHPFTVESTCLAVSGQSSTIRLEEIFKVDTIFTAIDRFRRIYRPTLNPTRPRFIHIDLAETTCAAAIACVHLKGFHKIEQFDARAGVQSEIVLPVVHVDFVLRIEPPKDMSEIDFEKILQFVFYLRDMGMPIGSVSFDQYQCFTKDTKISMLDGTEKSFGELEGEDEFWVYSIDDRGDVVPGRGHSCRKTGDQAPVFRVTLDNGESVRCTGGHLFKMRDGTYRRADQLGAGDSLMPLYRSYADRGSKKAAYEYHYNPRTRRRRLTHTHVFKYFNKEFRQHRFQDQTHVIHHKDLNPRNNSPANLELLEKSAHAKLHAEIAAASRQSWADRWREPGFRERHAERSSKSMQETWRTWREEMYEHTLRAVELSRSPEARAKRSASMRGNTNGNGAWQRTCRWCEKPFTATKAAQKFCTPECSKESRRVSHNAVCREAYAAKKAANNHRVVSVEFCGFEDVYDITVDEFHNFALSAGVFVHNSHHSMQVLEKAGIDNKEISLDRTPAPYKFLKQTINALCLDAYLYPPLRKEIRDLRRKMTSAREMVVKPDKGCFVGETRVPTLDGGCPQIKDLNGKEVWVYSARSDGSIVPGRARGRVTKTTTDLVDVILDSGAVERCTPDHEWMLRDGSYKRADALVPGADRLMPIKRSWPFNHGYERVRDAFGRRELTHTIVYEAATGVAVQEGYLVHHMNEVKTDNRPENLELLEKSEHSRHHTVKRHAEDPAYRSAVAGGLQRFNNSVEGRRKHAESMRRTVKSMSPEQLRQRSRNRFGFFRADVTFEKLVEVVVREKSESPNAAARALGCGRNVVLRVLRDAGISSWEDFVVGRNHRVRAVVPVRLETPVPVYDLEVDEFHNFALASGVFVHNSKDISDALAGAVYNLGHSPYLAEAALEIPIEGGQADEKATAGQQQKKGGFRVAAPAPAPGLSGDLGWVISGTPGAERITDIF